jgi:hypothetical protein
VSTKVTSNVQARLSLAPSSSVTVSTTL